MIGITAFGAYVPVYQLGRNEIARAWKTNDLGGERAVARHDEDSLTMAVAATLECIKRTPKRADALFFASTTPPYREKQAATIVAAATDLPMNSRTSDITDSVRAGTIAMGLAADAVKSGSLEEVIVVASDCRMGAGKSQFEQLLGDGAAAVVIGKSGVIASIEGNLSAFSEFIDVWRREGSAFTIDATCEACEDAGVDLKDIEAAWLGTVFSGHTALSLSSPLSWQYKPITRVENMCATGTEALRAAVYAVVSGSCDIALAVGVEKLKDTGWVGVQPINVVGRSTMGTAGTDLELSPPAMFSLMAQRYFHEFDIEPEEGRRLLAQIAVKNHHNGSLNPKAHFQNEITVEQILKAPIVAWPLGILDCCGVSDGAAAAIVTRADTARSFRNDPIYIKALATSVGPRRDPIADDFDFTHIEENVRVAQTAYHEAGIKNPLKELSVAEVHDCFTIHEMIIYEDLGWSPKGHAKEDIEAGTFALNGELPVNTDGGLKCFGHPLGASGLRMQYEVYKQLQEKAGPRQVKDPRLGLTHNFGGGIWGGIGCIAVTGNEIDRG